MKADLQAQFDKRFKKDGFLLQARLHQAMQGFSITVLFGPSGCGKTTILRCLAGLERPDTGSIQFEGETWFDAAKKIFLSPQERGIGFLFQDYALFPHLTVAQNIAYGIREASSRQTSARVSDMLELFALQGLESRYPRQLSGGQQQRVALARALASKPRLLLLDEPLSALDASLREHLRPELRQILASMDLPVVLVTHDRVETIALADWIYVLQEGKIQQYGSVQDVFNKPASLDVAQIVGVETVAPARILSVCDGLARIAIGNVELIAVAPTEPTQDVYACIRAEDVVLHVEPPGPSSARNRLLADITKMSHEGPLVRVFLECGFALTALVTRPACEELGLQVGKQVTALLKAPSIHLVCR